jgi:hypothetical protein
MERQRGCNHVDEFSGLPAEDNICDEYGHALKP